MGNFSVFNFFSVIKALNELIQDDNLGTDNLVDIHEQTAMLMQSAENKLFLMATLKTKDQPANLIWALNKLFRTAQDNRLRHKAWEILEPYMQADNDLFCLLINAVKEDDVKIAEKIAEKMLAIGDETYISTCLQSLADKPSKLADIVKVLLTKIT